MCSVIARGCGGYSVERMRIEKVKRIGRTLIERFPERFTSDFEKNKEVLRELLEISSKGLRNQLAGYIAHLLKKKSD